MRPASSCGVLLVALAQVFSCSPALGQPSDPLDRARELYLSGDVAAAARAFEAAAEVVTNAMDAASASNNACVLQTQLGDLDSARTNCEQAITRRRAAEDRFGEARARNNLGLVHQRAGRLQEARAEYTTALRINHSISELEGAVINQQNLGVIAVLQGRYDNALSFYRGAEANARRAAAPWSATQIRIARQNQGAALASLDAYQEALTIYLELLSTAAELSPGERANYELNAAVAYRNLGDAVEARARLERARSLFSELGDRSGESSALLNLALVLHHGLQRPQEALAVVREALRLARQSSDVAEELQDLAYLSEILVDLQRFAEAEEALELAAELGSRAAMAEASWITALGRARLLEAQGEHEGAVGAALDAVSQIEALGRSVADVGDRTRYLEHRRRAYRLAVDLLTRAAGPQSAANREQALAIVLRAKARDLFDHLGLDLRAPLRSIDTQLLAQHAAGAVLVEWFDLGDQLVCFVLHDGHTSVHRVAARSEVLAAAARVREDLVSGKAPLQRDLLELSARLLSGIPVQRRLILAPSAALAYLPWEILSTAEGPLLDTTEVTYLPSIALLLAEHRAARAGRLAWIAVAAGSNAGSLTGAGDDPASPPGIAAAASRATLGESDLTSAHLPQLPFAEDEVAMVAQTLPGQGMTLLDADATASNLLRRLRSPGADIVHLAVHAVIDERPGQGAQLMLTDGALGPEELASESLDVGLAVLAACSTRWGAEVDSRSLHTLSGAWIAAGADAVLTTLWDVDDETTLAFMEQFYAQLALGHAPAAALARTKRRVSRDPAWRNPSTWAGYVLTGTSAPISRSTPGAQLRRWRAGQVLLASLALAMLLCIVWAWRRQTLSLR